MNDPKSMPTMDPGASAPQNNRRVNPRQVSTGTLYGKQGVGSQGVVIDNDNRRITINASDGSQIGFGVIPGSDPEEIGFFTIDASTNLIHKNVNGALFFYDTDGNLIQEINAGVIYFYDTEGNLVQKIDTGTRYVYDVTNGTNVLQDGKLPDNSYGFAIATTGNNVVDIFS